MDNQCCSNCTNLQTKSVMSQKMSHIQTSKQLEALLWIGAAIEVVTLVDSLLTGLG